jgi:hypothetical protein
MKQTKRKYNVVNGKIVPKYSLSLEEKAKRQAKQQELYQRCYQVFARVQPQLIKEHYNWYMVVEPDSGEYFIDQNEIVASQKARDKYPNSQRLKFRVNETGACGRI